MATSNIKKCKERDEKIFELLTGFRFMYTRHFQVLLGCSYDVINRRLNKLVKQKLIKRWRPYNPERYVYFMEKRTQDFRHCLAVVSAYCYLKTLNPNEEWEPEVTFSMLRTDGYARQKNAFVEVDRGTNPFDKPEKYRSLFDSDEWVKKKCYASRAFRYKICDSETRIRFYRYPRGERYVSGFKESLVYQLLKNRSHRKMDQG